MGEVQRAREPKFTDEDLDYDFDLTPWLTAGETVTDVTAWATQGLTVVGTDKSRLAEDGVVVVRVSGGVAGPEAFIHLLAELSDGEKPGLALKLRIVDR